MAHRRRWSTSRPRRRPGRRKTSVASIRLQPGSGAIKVNGRDFTDYFAGLSVQNQILRPLEIANPVHLANSHTLIEIDEALRIPLKQEGLLTRDPRMKERKSPNTAPFYLGQFSCKILLRHRPDHFPINIFI